MSTLGLYPEDIFPEILYFKWPSKNKMQHMYKNILKEGNGDQKYIRWPDLWDNFFEVMSSTIALDKVKLMCAETVKDKPTINDSGLSPTQEQLILLIYG